MALLPWTGHTTLSARFSTKCFTCNLTGKKRQRVWPELRAGACSRRPLCSLQGRQEDAEEYLGFILNGLHEEMLALKKLLSPDSESRSECVQDPILQCSGLGAPCMP